MNCRRHGSKPTIALWMLVAAADIGLLVAATGVVTMLLIAAALAGGFLTVRAISRQAADVVSQPAVRAIPRPTVATMARPVATMARPMVRTVETTARRGA